MPDSQRKHDLLARMRAEHTQLESLLCTLSEEQMLSVTVAGTWSVKDVLVHLAWWEQDILRKMDAGEPLDPEQKSDLLVVDHSNARIVEAKRLTPLADVLTTFLASYQRLLRALEELEDEAFEDEHTYNYLATNTWAHYAEHRVWIAAGLQPRRRFFQ